MRLKEIKPTPAAQFIKQVAATHPRNPLNPNEIVLHHTSDSVVLFDLRDSHLGPNWIHISFMSSYPQRTGLGTIGMRKLQDLAAKAGISMELVVWHKGPVKPKALERFYKKMGFKPGLHGRLVWEPTQTKMEDITTTELDKPTSTVDQLAKKYKVDRARIEREVAKGIKVEKEHTSHDKVAREIALDHLGEKLDYYEKLAKVELEESDKETKWSVTYDIYHSNRDKPLYTNTRTVIATSADDAKRIVQKFIGGTNHKVVPKK